MKCRPIAKVVFLNLRARRPGPLARHEHLVVSRDRRRIDAFRVFDLVYVMTAGGPGTATEPIALYTFSRLLQTLRFGFGSALSVIVFAVSFVFALACISLLGRDALVERAS